IVPNASGTGASLGGDRGETLRRRTALRNAHQDKECILALLILLMRQGGIAI
ncbi:MAG: hypothetical protein HC800_22710, partial [Phormidesmis sp. RL_2_1]|nr:hypothetical protein [Phormidesmis sp. RL_2_1]